MEPQVETSEVSTKEGGIPDRLNSTEIAQLNSLIKD